MPVSIGKIYRKRYIEDGVPATVLGMSDLTPRRSSGLSRSQKESRAYGLVVAGGVAGAVAVVGGVLALVGVINWGLPLLGVVVAAVCALLFRRMVRPR
jgi:hypothetical protein